MRELLSKKEQEAYLYSKIGKPVNFKYPEPPFERKGELLDRHVTKVSENDLVVYWYLIDRIRFEGENEDWLRITYCRYKKKERRWVFAGQTSLSGPISNIQKLFIEAIKKKDWVKPLFREVFKQCRKELGL